MQHIVFDKQKTSIIKGLAIVMMILLHCFGGQGWYDSHIPAMDNARLVSFMGAFKFCVAIYAFMVGYGYNFAKNKDLRYSFLHIAKLLIPAWVIIVLFSFPVAHTLNPEIAIKNLFGINSSLHWLSWFIYFYIASILLITLNIEISEKTYFSERVSSDRCRVYLWYIIRKVLRRNGQ